MQYLFAIKLSCYPPSLRWSAFTYQNIPKSKHPSIALENCASDSSVEYSFIQNQIQCERPIYAWYSASTDAGFVVLTDQLRISLTGWRYRCSCECELSSCCWCAWKRLWVLSSTAEVDSQSLRCLSQRWARHSLWHSWRLFAITLKNGDYIMREIVNPQPERVSCKSNITARSSAWKRLSSAICVVHTFPFLPALSRIIFLRDVPQSTEKFATSFI